MTLNEITADIRLRNPWEAIDLGMSMTQHWWKSLYFPLVIVTTCIAALLYIFVPKESFWISSLIFWLLKPLYDRIALHVVSRKLFNQTLNTWQVIKAIPWLLWNTGFFQSLSFRRLALSRGFSLPIWQLEQLRGDQRANRQKTLFQSSHTQAIWLTIGCVVLEMVLFFSLLAIFYFFLPKESAANFITSYLGNNNSPEFWAEVVAFVIYVIVVTIVHPMYISSSFALYINRRTQLEAWDIELEFRKLAQRIKEDQENKLTLNQETAKNRSTLHAFIVAIIVSLLIGSHSKTEAEENELVQLDTKIVLKKHEEKFEILAKHRKDVGQSKSMAKETTHLKELDDKKIIKYWALKDKPKKEEKKKKDLEGFDAFWESFGKVMAFIIEFGLWIVLGIGVILLLIYRKYLLSLFTLNQSKDDDEYQAPEVMFGMNVRSDSLPNDILSVFKELWKDGNHREALSLLYRAALVDLINKDQVKLLNSHTENDVLEQAQIFIDYAKFNYLAKLTNAWKEIAYAHRVPSNKHIAYLADHWYSEFANIQTPPLTDSSDGSNDEQ